MRVLVVIARLVIWLSCCGSQLLSAQETKIEVVNNQPFAIRMPVEIRNFALRPGNWGISDEQWVQQSGSNIIFVANVEPSITREFTLQKVTAQKKRIFSVQPDQKGLKLMYGGRDFGTLCWDVVMKNVDRTRQESDASVSKRQDFNKNLQPLPMEFRRCSEGPVFDGWSAAAVKNGVELALEVRAFHDGFLDINASLVNESSASSSNVYAAVVCRWEQANPRERSLCYDNRISKLAEKGWSRFREGEGRHQFIQRGVDWVRTSFSDNATAIWLNDFAPSFTLQAEATARNPAHFTGANLPQLGQEIQSAGPRLYSITEIARSNVRSFRDRLKENTLPPKGESISFSSRIAFSSSPLSDSAADQMFVGWTSYNAQELTGRCARVSFGARAVRFGTSYFPYSTLGENFDFVKLPGMDRESFWPLAADTVNQWRSFADDIRRDLRIAKAMGFQFIRLHHLELLGPIDKQVRQEYLDFLFDELRHLQLKASLDVYASPEQITELLKRYGDVVDSVEIENEILIWGIPLDRPVQWKALYDAVKKTAPDVRVHLTGYNNTGMFDRLEDLGVPFDRVCLHSYIDSVEAIPSARGYALALSSYASKHGKPPVITEWNWRGLTRLTPEARAKIYPPIIENAVGTRGIPEFYQFQFNETLCPNPRSGRGNILRHYELLNLSRTLKPEALELVKLITKYADPQDPVRLLEINFAEAEFDAQGRGSANLILRNRSAKPLDLKISLEIPGKLQGRFRGADSFQLRAGGEAKIPLTLECTNTDPGFYHVFARFEIAGRNVRYGWITARLNAAPKLDPAADPAVTYPHGVLRELEIDFKKPIAVVYGEGAPALEVETAFAISQTLASAIGKRVEIFQLNDLPTARRDHLILVGTTASHQLFAPIKNRLPAAECFVARVDEGEVKSSIVIGGADSRNVERAGMDFVLRYWQNAKDSAARRVGLVAKELPRGGDAAKLP